MRLRRRILALGLLAVAAGLESPALAQSAAPAADKAPSPGKQPAEDKSGGEPSAAPLPGPGAGYTWSDAPKKKGNGVRHRPLKVDPTKPLASSPSFAMLADGRSVVSLYLSKKTPVTRGGTGTLVHFELPSVQIGVWNNTNPLVTTHFATPLARVQLHRTKTGAQLELVLRSAVNVTHEVLAGPGGTLLLKITLPALSGAARPEGGAPPAPPAAPSPAKP